MLSLRGEEDPGHMWGIDFLEEFMDKIPTMGLQNFVKSDQVIFFKFIVVVVYFLQIIDINCQAVY